MDVVAWITDGIVAVSARWVVGVAAFLAFAGLGGYGLALRRAALRDHDALAPRRARDAGAMAVIAAVLALVTQVLCVPAYARSLWGYTARATIVRVTGGRGSYTLNATYRDGSGRTQPALVQVTRRVSNIADACERDKIQAQLDLALATVTSPKPRKLTRTSTGCEPLDLLVVDGWPSLAQLAPEPLVNVQSVVLAAILWGVVLSGMRQARSSSARRDA